MLHRNAPLTPLGRERLARCVVEDHWSLRRAAERFQVSVGTADRWAARFRKDGPDGMHDRSSRPHHSPHQTPTRRERRIIKVRVLRRGPPATRVPNFTGQYIYGPGWVSSPGPPVPPSFAGCARGWVGRTNEYRGCVGGRSRPGTGRIGRESQPISAHLAVVPFQTFSRSESSIAAGSHVLSWPTGRFE
jgi:hypothetical protein